MNSNIKALIVIDVQNGLTKKKTLFKENLFIETVNSAVKSYRASNSKIIFVQHNNNQLRFGTSDWEIDPRIDKHENDITVGKKHGNAFQNTDLKQILLNFKISSIIICGLVSHGCVKATCMGGLTEGFETSLLKYGHTNWNKDAQNKINVTEGELIKSGVLLEEIQYQSVDPGTEKTLHDMTTTELGQLFPIFIQKYTDKWIDLYQWEKQLITDSFSKSDIVAINHIGSTAIPGIQAKPTIDILLQIMEQINIQKVEDIFKSIGYQLTKQPDNPPPHMTFVKGYTNKGFKGQVYHVHVRYKGDWDEIRFRDYLINHKEIAEEYELLKLELADKYRNDRDAYTDSKTEWIEKINKLTRK